MIIHQRAALEPKKDGKRRRDAGISSSSAVSNEAENIDDDETNLEFYN
jgi:hypothetical protein